MLDTLALAISVAVASPHPLTRDVTTTETLHLPQAPESERQETAHRMYAKLNDIRDAAGLPELAFDDGLSAVALEHARDMLAHEYFGHVSPTGETPAERLTKAGVHYRITGENIAFCKDEHEAEIALWHSNGHRRNELDKRFRRTGVAVIRTGTYGALFVQIYAD